MVIPKTTKKIYKTTKEKTLEFKRELRKQSITAITAAFGFLIALVWKDAIVDLVEKISLASQIQNSILLNFATAIVITFIAVLSLMILAKYNTKKTEQEDKT